MNPCTSFRESVALFACGSLDADQVGPVRQHLHTCAGCRGYLDQLSTLATQHSTAARELPEATLPPRVYGRITAALRPDSLRRSGRSLRPVSLGLGWFAAGTALVILLLGGRQFFRQPAVSPVISEGSPVRGMPEAGPRVPAAGMSSQSINLFTYRLALSVSPDELDQLLAREAARPAFKPSDDFRLGIAKLGGP